jgi:hypothetical protein
VHLELFQGAHRVHRRCHGHLHPTLQAGGFQGERWEAAATQNVMTCWS